MDEWEAREVAYAAAKADPIAAAILEALHTQDVRTYNGHSAGLGQLALDTANTVRNLLKGASK